jgi:hypothetical protein
MSVMIKSFYNCRLLYTDVGGESRVEFLPDVAEIIREFAARKQEEGDVINGMQYYMSIIIDGLKPFALSHDFNHTLLSASEVVELTEQRLDELKVFAEAAVDPYMAETHGLK